MNKYGARRTWSELCQREFASMKECRRAEELTLLEKAGEIDALEFQVPFVLSVKPKITITIDFKYKDYALRERILADRTLRQTYIVYEDSKGMLTRDTRTKLAWLKEKHGIDVILS
ncbi:hypothetical protein LCGC14_2201630 [marine sediment metagenome]|uniref:Uncharacterized protein n=1 Tax=marine sediment metagenome TaxID=412755 RepID=A0A0F9FTZ4_9ZZZZ